MLRAAILHECQKYLRGGGGLGGSEKNIFLFFSPLTPLTHSAASASKCSMNRSLERKDDYKFSTAKDPLFNSTGFCMVEDHCRQEHRCDCLCTDRSLSMLEQRLKRAVQKAYLDYSRRGKKEMFFKSHTGEQGTSLYSVHVSQKGRCT